MAITKTFVAHSQLKASDLNELKDQANAYISQVDGKSPDIENTAGADLEFTDENSNSLVMFRNGHIRTKKFDSASIIDKVNGKVDKTEGKGLSTNDYTTSEKTKLASVEPGAEVNDVNTGNAESDADLEISDETGNTLVMFQDGHLRTKKFNSAKDVMSASEKTKLTSIEPGAEVNDVETGDSSHDFCISDENDNIIFAILNGILSTKNFNGRKVLRDIEQLKSQNSIPEWKESWSKMPLLGSNPLEKVRFDGGCARIFKHWGFIGDSLSSGEMYGRITNELTIEEDNVGKEITSGGLVDNQNYITTAQYAVSGNTPKLRLVFNSASGINGKILAAKVNSADSMDALITGSSTITTYTVDLVAGSNILISYPSDNKPQILFQKTYVSDMYELSWGQQIVRLLGSDGYNFSVGGESCKRWCTGADNNRRWNKVRTETTVRDVYTIALGVNDRNYWLNNQTSVVDYPCVTAYPNQSQYGSLTITEENVTDDVDFTDYDNNENSYAGWYAGIIQRVKSVRPDAHIFCLTNPSIESEWNQVIRILVNKFNELYPNTIWLVDLRTYNPFNNQIRTYIDLNGHYSAFGYLYGAYQISTYIDWIIRNNILAFKGSSLIGTGSTADDWHIL